MIVHQHLMTKVLKTTWPTDAQKILSTFNPELYGIHSQICF
jgi:hypothetical protein